MTTQAAERLSHPHRPRHPDGRTDAPLLDSGAAVLGNSGTGLSSGAAQALSERLIAFRDTKGRVGVMDEFCAHRGVSLWFGRNEENGLRCPYHGWKYDVTGQCIEVPSEPVESGFCNGSSSPPIPASRWAT